MADSDSTLLISYPPTGSEFRGVLEESVDALASLTSVTEPNIVAIDQVRQTALSSRLPLAAATAASRVWLSVLCDLASQGWLIGVNGDAVALTRPDSIRSNATAEKARIRNAHLIERDRLLRDEATRRFVHDMETMRLYKGKWHSIFSLMRDGRELEAACSNAVGREISTQDPLRSAVQPYLQFVESDAECEHTGLRLLDVWRYFRLTWSTVPQSVPGRRMLVLVRDRAAENHPIVGIALLGSAVVQLGVRDNWIGWTPDTFIAHVRSNRSSSHVRWVLAGVRDALQAIYVRDFLRDGLITRKQISAPSMDDVKRLRAFAQRARRAHERFARSGGHKRASSKPENADWQEQAETFLFQSKRALALAFALEVRATLQQLGITRASRAALDLLLDSPGGRRALASVMRFQKAKHVGIDMLDITVCGAVAPYTHMLGGKLVTLLMTSPEVVQAYRLRYGRAVSIIASSISGRLVRRRPRLVLLGTTSLYGVGSSQYNRLVIPKSAAPNLLRDDIRFQELGHSLGFGSYHFGRQTFDEMNTLVQLRHAGRRVNFIFGEGVNPRMRLVREALDAVGLPANVLLQHRTPRLVYAAALAVNFRDVLVGRSMRPSYIFNPEFEASQATESIAQYWRTRWLAARARKAEIMVQVAAHSTLRPVQHGARVHQVGDELDLPLFR